MAHDFRRFTALLIVVLGCSDPDDDGAAPGGGGTAAGGVSGASGSAGTGGAPAAPGGGGTGSSVGAGGSGATGTGASSGSAGSGGVAAGAGGTGTGGDAGSAGQAGTGVTISGRQIQVGGVPFHIQGVCWNPVPRGGAHPADLDFAGASAGDIPLMQSAGINAVRTYEPLTDRAVLDALYAAGIYVLDTVYPYGAQTAADAVQRVEAIKDHPAVLMWVIGNEWNYNGLYVDLPHDQAMARLNEVAAAIRAVDTSHPISTVYGELPSAETVQAMPDIDVWGLNVYRGIEFGSLFQDWAARSQKPMYVAEYGADAWNANIGAEDPASQAQAVASLTLQIRDNAAAFSAGGVCAGGTVFEWADEWWKDQSGSASEQDVGGSAPGGGPYPDQVFNEEWWGIVDIDRNPRPAYDELAEIFGG